MTFEMRKRFSVRKAGVAETLIGCSVLLKRLLIGVLVSIASYTLAWAETPVLRVSVLKIGTVNWELDTIKHNRLDAKYGFALDVSGTAGNAASRIAFQGGQADVIVADWIWVARQRADGKNYVFVPYSKAIGGLMVPLASAAQNLADLQGAKIGIAGGPVDKSWLILQAYAQQEFGFDLADKTEQVFAAPPLIYKSALRGDVQAAINFWHFGAKMQSNGMKELVSVATASKALGLPLDMPLLGYVFKGQMLKDHPDLIKAFIKASYEAKKILADTDAAWDRLRPMMRAKTDSDFAALKAGFRAGIPKTGLVDEVAASQFLEAMAKLGGEKLVGRATVLPAGVFVNFKD